MDGSVGKVVGGVLRSPGRPLDVSVRSEFEPRFGVDLGAVRVHTDSRAAASARMVGAQAYTVGRDIVFGSGRHAPQTVAGRHLLAHELAHVLQQADSSSVVPTAANGIAPADGLHERQADDAANAAVAGGPLPPSVTGRLLDTGAQNVNGVPPIQRKVVVHKPQAMIPNPGGKGLAQTNATTVGGYLSKLCPAGGVTVDAGTGAVTIGKGFCTAPALAKGTYGPARPSPAQGSATPTGCGCLCDLDGPNTWNIKIDDASWPHTDFDDVPKAMGKVPGGSGGTVTAPSPNSPKLWGAGSASGVTLDIDPWLVLGHELCGHGWLGNAGQASLDELPARGEGGHQETVARENALRAEHGIEARGTFKEPNCGESYWRDKAAPATENWSSYRAVCATWRQDYNRKKGTSFTINDKIP